MKTNVVLEKKPVIKGRESSTEEIVSKANKIEAKDEPLTSELLRKINAYWRAANYLSVGQIYLYDNPLLKKPLKMEHVKPLVVGHWGTTPGQNFIYVHLNRVIKKFDLDMFYIAGPVMVALHWWAILISKAPIVRFIPISPRMKTE